MLVHLIEQLIVQIIARVRARIVLSSDNSTPFSDKLNDSPLGRPFRIRSIPVRPILSTIKSSEILSSPK